MTCHRAQSRVWMAYQPDARQAVALGSADRMLEARMRRQGPGAVDARTAGAAANCEDATA